MFVPAFGSIDDIDYQQHDRNLDQHADDGGQRGPGMEPKQANGGGHREFEEVRRADEGRRTRDIVAHLGTTSSGVFAQPLTAHWGIPDPAAVEGTEVERKFAFRQAFKAMETRIKLFLSLPIASIDKMRLQERMNAIGRTPLEVVPK